MMRPLTAVVYMIASSLATLMSNANAMSGIVLDDTQSPLGHHFSQAFGLVWHDQAVSARHVVTVVEHASARGGHRITILANQRVVFQTYLSRQRRDLTTLALQAGQRVAQQLRIMETTAWREPDLAPDEL